MPVTQKPVTNTNDFCATYDVSGDSKQENANSYEKLYPANQSVPKLVIKSCTKYI